MSKNSQSFRIKYTELVGGDNERESEMVIKTKDIKWTLEQFGRNRHIVKIDAKQLNNK
tara:strand:- start:2209 stop:2382 length:174 start_codon:yes stop_codon:yes gene_type:complete